MALQSGLNEVRKAAEDVGKGVEEWRRQGTLEELEAKMNPQDFVELNLNLAYALSSLYYSYLKVRCIETSSHPIMNDIGRVQAAFLRYSEKREQMKESMKNKNKIDKEAANRMMKGHLKSLEKDEKYIEKQRLLAQEEERETNHAERLKVVQQNLNLWDDEKDGKEAKQKLVRGNLIPKVGHLNWKSEVEKIINKK